MMSTTARWASGPNPNRALRSGTSAAGGPNVTSTSSAKSAGNWISTSSGVPGRTVTVTRRPLTR